MVIKIYNYIITMKLILLLIFAFMILFISSNPAGSYVYQTLLIWSFKIQ